jgi:hypothetical protein
MIYYAFQALSRTPTFQSLNSSLGPSNFVFQLGNQITSGVTHASLGFKSIANGTITNEFWEVNLTSNTTSGPVIQSAPNLLDTTMDSENWEGPSSWIPGSPTPQLDSTQTDQVFPTVYANGAGQANVPSGVTVDEVTSIWDGLTDSSNNLLQDGWDTDASNPLPYGNSPFYELYCPSACNNNAIHNYFVSDPNTPSAVAGDKINELVKWSGAPYYWILEDKDYSSNQYGMVNVSVYSAGLTGGYHPQYSNEILETFTWGTPSHIEQLAYFSSFDFYDIQICPSRQVSSCSYAYNTSSNTYQLIQDCSSWWFGIVGGTCYSSVFNAGTSYTNSNGGYWGDLGYWGVGWSSSSYDYNCVTGGYNCF